MPKALDLTGQRFGKLVALKRAPRRDDKYTRWICQCDCGSIAEIRTDYLRNGHTTSCGCTKAQHFTITEYEGQKFGRLTVIERADGRHYKCKCDCGNIVIVETSNLTMGTTQSCGCLQKERASQASLKSLIGERFGKLTVIERVENNRFGHVCYKCKCDCGGITIVDASNLRGGHTSSCGCIKSKGEMLINQWLQNHNIEFKPQYSVEGMKFSSGRAPYFDFGIFKDGELQFLLEYDGNIHFEANELGWNTEERLKKTQQRDNEKNQECKRMGIKLIRIKYDEPLEERLQEIFKEVISNE